MERKPWSSFLGAKSTTHVADLTPTPITVSPDDLVDMQLYRKPQRTKLCGGHDPIRVVVAYAQDELVYDDVGNVSLSSNRTSYLALPREKRVNKFGKAYLKSAKLQLHRTLADIVIGAAIHLYQTQNWTTVLYDGLRTVDGAYNLYTLAQDSDMESGLLSMPGQSAHNKGLAVDSMMRDISGKEVDMGAHFDHLDMRINARTYIGDGISLLAQRNRMLREAAFLRSALTQGLLVAPLRNEFWDDRLPENREDLWRVLDSAARVMCMDLLSPEDERLRKTDRKAFSEKWENWSYEQFVRQWVNLFKGQEAKLKSLLGVTLPPTYEKLEFYHGNYHPIYDATLRTSGKNITDNV